MIHNKLILSGLAFMALLCVNARNNASSEVVNYQHIEKNDKVLKTHITEFVTNENMPEGYVVVRTVSELEKLLEEYLFDKKSKIDANKVHTSEDIVALRNSIAELEKRDSLFNSEKEKIDKKIGEAKSRLDSLDTEIKSLNVEIERIKESNKDIAESQSRYSDYLESYGKIDPQVVKVYQDLSKKRMDEIAIDEVVKVISDTKNNPSLNDVTKEEIAKIEDIFSKVKIYQEGVNSLKKPFDSKANINIITKFDKAGNLACLSADQQQQWNEVYGLLKNFQQVTDNFDSEILDFIDGEGEVAENDINYYKGVIKARVEDFGDIDEGYVNLSNIYRQIMTGLTAMDANATQMFINTLKGKIRVITTKNKKK